jgi:hypothetical protein
MMRRRRKANGKKNRTHAEQSATRTVNPATLPPDELRSRVREALLKLSPAERSAVRDHLLAQLHQAGVNISSCLFSLGITAKIPGVLTASDMAYLIRYVRINSPHKLGAVARLLSVLLFPDDDRKKAFRLAA